MERQDIAERRGSLVDVFPRLPARFVGRREELEWLYNGLRMSIRDSRATRLFLHGEAGLGKTRLVHEFMSLVEPERKGEAGKVGDSVSEIRAGVEVRSRSGRSLRGIWRGSRGHSQALPRSEAAAGVSQAASST